MARRARRPARPDLAGPVPRPAAMQGSVPTSAPWWSCMCTEASGPIHKEMKEEQLRCNDTWDTLEEEVTPSRAFASAASGHTFQVQNLPKSKYMNFSMTPLQSDMTSSRDAYHFQAQPSQVGKSHQKYGLLSLSEFVEECDLQQSPFDTEAPRSNLLRLDTAPNSNVMSHADTWLGALRKQHSTTNRHFLKSNTLPFSQRFTEEDMLQYVSRRCSELAVKLRCTSWANSWKPEYLMLAWRAFPVATCLSSRCLRFLLVLLAAIAALIVIFVGNNVGDEFMLFQDYPSRGDPNYLVDFFGKQCVYLKDKFTHVLHDIEASNRQKGWIEVTFPARGDKREIKAWYFPSITPAVSPRVVVAHGMSVNNLHHSVQTVAHFLRSMNISVLVPNLRHHGGRLLWRSRPKLWKNQYLDVLGAWDYAVMDPHGSLGGNLRPNLVGLMGFDYGGLAVQAAFGIEPTIGSILLDGAVHDMRKLFLEFLKQKVSLAWLFEQQAWSRVEAIAGHHWDTEDSISSARGLLMSRSQGGTLGIIHSVDDTAVPALQHDSLMETLSKSKALGDAVLMQWLPTFQGDVNCKEKRATHLDRHEQYRSFLCAFWWMVFSRKHNFTELPHCANYGAPPQ